jgi:hypothetical protein
MGMKEIQVDIGQLEQMVKQGIATTSKEKQWIWKGKSQVELYSLTLNPTRALETLFCIVEFSLFLEGNLPLFV